MGEVKVKIPWPYDDRSLYLKICSIPADEGDGVMVLIKSLSDKMLGIDIEKDAKCTEMTLNFMTCHIQMISENKQVLRILCNVDPNFTNVPPFLINNTFKFASVFFLKTVASKAENLSD